MKKIRYNKYIDKIGVEFEGIFTASSVDKLVDNYSGICYRDIIHDTAHFYNNNIGRLMAEYKRDGSIAFDYYIENNEDEYIRREITTKPLKSRDITTVLQYFNRLQKNSSYYINNSVGLHYHISINGNYYAYLVNPVFYDLYKKMFYDNFFDVYDNRINNNYCDFNYTNNDIQSSSSYTDNYKKSRLLRDINRHFSLSSGNRYHAINYCYRKHKTIEFRAYGGQYATIQGLSDLIQKTINLIGQFINNTENNLISRSVKRRVITDFNNINDSLYIQQRVQKKEDIFYKLSGKTKKQSLVINLNGNNEAGNNVFYNAGTNTYSHINDFVWQAADNR